MLTRYFDATVDGHTRISAVEFEDWREDDIDTDFRDQTEIDAADLPADFADWKRCEAFGRNSYTVQTFSRLGD